MTEQMKQIEHNELTEEQIQREWMRWNLPANVEELLEFRQLEEADALQKAFKDGLKRGYALAKKEVL